MHECSKTIPVGGAPFAGPSIEHGIAGSRSSSRRKNWFPDNRSALEAGCLREATLSEERVERRLAAILAADVAGYSRLMGVDEEGTLARLKEHRARA